MLDVDKQIADSFNAPWNRLERETWDVQYWSRSAGGWVAFKEYENEEEAFWKAEVLAEGLKVRIMAPDNSEAWKSRG